MANSNSAQAMPPDPSSSQSSNCCLANSSSACVRPWHRRRCHRTGMMSSRTSSSLESKPNAFKDSSTTSGEANVTFMSERSVGNSLAGMGPSASPRILMRCVRTRLASSSRTTRTRRTMSNSVRSMSSACSFGVRPRWALRTRLVYNSISSTAKSKPSQSKQALASAKFSWPRLMRSIRLKAETISPYSSWVKPMRYRMIPRIFAKFMKDTSTTRGPQTSAMS
mmetsp:Transcript_54582/g.127289  ORF Transcript_54582/g.127289 Transcript_54582/m.127289 type:complete len:223 (-) Transcript_54582:865-1533(-)